MPRSFFNWIWSLIEVRETRIAAEAAEIEAENYMMMHWDNGE